MESRDFAFWLQGFFELTNSESLTPEQVRQIKTHLALVFKHDAACAHGALPHVGSDPMPPLRDQPFPGISDRLLFRPRRQTEILC